MQIRLKMQTADWVQNADWEFILFFRLIRDNISSYNWPSVTQCFSATIFHYYLHYCGIFLACFFITIVLNIISSFHAVFSLCARVGWWDVCTEFTKLIKVVADVNWIFITWTPVLYKVVWPGEKPSQHAWKNIVFFHVCWYNQSAAYTSLAFGAIWSGWWMNGQAFMILNTSCLSELSQIMASKTIKNPYRW